MLTLFKQKIYDNHSIVRNSQRKTKQNRLKIKQTYFAGSLKNVLLWHTVIVIAHMHIPHISVADLAVTTWTHENGICCRN